jgi:nicotinamidase-related amidase
MPSAQIPHPSPAALILIDVINHFEFPDGDKVLRQALAVAPKLSRLKKRAQAAGMSSIYVNDNFGQWRSDVSKLLDYCVRPEALGRSFVEQIQPEESDYFILKPMHSGFYQTPLEVLLRFLGASTLLLCGVTTNSCIVCTAHDAKMREYELYVPSDCSAARTAKEHRQAIEHIRMMTAAKVTPSGSLRLAEIVKTARNHYGHGT